MSKDLITMDKVGSSVVNDPPYAQVFTKDKSTLSNAEQTKQSESKIGPALCPLSPNPTCDKMMKTTKNGMEYKEDMKGKEERGRGYDMNRPQD